MKYAAFEQLAREEWDRIPEEYKAGVDGLIIERDAKAHPTAADVYTLGECVTEGYLSDYTGPDTTRSSVVLYFGSFRRAAQLDPGFDWREELWETLTHELQHHLESLASDEALMEMDYATDEDIKRLEGQAFDPDFFRRGQLLGGGWYRVGDALFLEHESDGTAGPLDFELEGVRYRISVPGHEPGLTFVGVESGLPDDAPEVTVVLVRREGMRGLLRALFGRRGRGIAELAAAAERVDS